jgi:ATP synthase protein I
MRLDPKTLRAMSLVSGLGFSIAVCLIGSILAGHWADDQLHTRPLFLIVGILFGLFGAGAVMYSLLTPWTNADGAKCKNQDHES